MIRFALLSIRLTCCHDHVRHASCAAVAGGAEVRDVLVTISSHVSWLEPSLII